MIFKKLFNICMIDVLSKKDLVLSKTNLMMLKNVYISEMVERFQPMFTKIFL